MSEMSVIKTDRYPERIVDSMVDEYVKRLTELENYEWTIGQWEKTTVIMDTRITYEFRPNRTTFNGNLERARTMVQILQCKKEIDDEKGERLTIHKRVQDQGTQTEWRCELI